MNNYSSRVLYSAIFVASLSIFSPHAYTSDGLDEDNRVASEKFNCQIYHFCKHTSEKTQLDHHSKISNTVTEDFCIARRRGETHNNTKHLQVMAHTVDSKLKCNALVE